MGFVDSGGEQNGCNQMPIAVVIIPLEDFITLRVLF